MNPAPKNFWNSLNALVAVLIALVAVCIVGGIKIIGHIGQNPNSVSTISVDGTGDAIAVPDIATFSFSVTETAKTVGDAQTQATTKVNAALKALRDEGIADKDISTQSYNISQHYDYTNRSSVLNGYDVSETIFVKVRDLTKAGSIFTSIGTLGVQNVNGLDFSVDDPKAVQAQARDKAIADAKAKADVLAGQLGVSIVRVVSFSENTGGGYPRPIMYAMDKAVMSADVAAPAPEIPTGEQKVTSNVTITYEIE